MSELWDWQGTRSLSFSIPTVRNEPRSGNRRIGRFNNKRTTPVGRWKAKVATYARLAIARIGQKRPMAGPVRVSVTCVYPRPTKATQRRHEARAGRPLDGVAYRKTSTPDADNLLKPILDGLKAAGVYMDDSQVELGPMIRRYASDAQDKPRVEVLVDPIPYTFE